MNVTSIDGLRRMSNTVRRQTGEKREKRTREKKYGVGEGEGEGEGRGWGGWGMRGLVPGTKPPLPGLPSSS